MSTRVLPRPAGDRARTSSWAARLACSADHRAKHTVYAALAAKLIIRDGEVHDQEETP